MDVYWKNGNANPIPALNSSAALYGIAVSGTDVYLAGSDVIKYGDTRSVYWKNGVEVFYSPYSGGYVSDIGVDGSNVYFLDQSAGAAYFENGIERKMQGPTKSYPHKIFVVHHD